jgi:hypothetical protein
MRWVRLPPREQAVYVRVQQEHERISEGSVWISYGSTDVTVGIIVCGFKQETHLWERSGIENSLI